jgi:hypothetical protein
MKRFDHQFACYSAELALHIVEQCMLLPFGLFCRFSLTWRNFPLWNRLRVWDGQLLAERLRSANLLCSTDAALRLKDLEEYCTDLTDKLFNVQKSYEEAKKEINLFSSRVSDNNVSMRCFPNSANEAFRAERTTKRPVKTRPTSKNAKKR